MTSRIDVVDKDRLMMEQLAIIDMKRVLKKFVKTNSNLPKLLQ